MFVVDGAPQSLDCPKNMRDQVFQKILPPFEELFDEVEEYCLELLFEAWCKLVCDDTDAFEKVCSTTT